MELETAGIRNGHSSRIGRGINEAVTVYRTLNIIDEFTKEALVIRVKRKLNSTGVVDALTDLFILRGPPDYIRSDNGAEFITKKGARLDRGGWRKVRFHHSRITVGNRILRELQRPLPRRASQRRGLLHPTRSPNPDRTMAPQLQHGQAT